MLELFYDFYNINLFTSLIRQVIEQQFNKKLCIIESILKNRKTHVILWENFEYKSSKIQATFTTIEWPFTNCDELKQKFLYSVILFNDFNEDNFIFNEDNFIVVHQKYYEIFYPTVHIHWPTYCLCHKYGYLTKRLEY